MRITYYRFPENTAEKVLLENGCAIITTNGEEIYEEVIPNEYRHLVDHIDDTINCSITFVKKMLKQYGGCAWTEHIDRDGGMFEVTEVKLTGNNSHFKYIIYN